MTGTNHAITGGVIGLAIGGPLAILVAFFSHFALDWLPHYGLDAEDRLQRRRFFMKSVAVDGVLLSGLLVAGIAYALPWYVFGAALAAMAPDFSWMYRYVIEEKLGRLEPKPKNKFDQWHSDIQKKETVQPGVWVELVWFIAMIMIAINLV